MTDERKRVPVTKARQGVMGHNVRYVLAISLGGAALALLVLAIVFS